MKRPSLKIYCTICVGKIQLLFHQAKNPLYLYAYMAPLQYAGLDPLSKAGANGLSIKSSNNNLNNKKDTHFLRTQDSPLEHPPPTHFQ
jgi:hypothetical protein